MRRKHLSRTLIAVSIVAGFNTDMKLQGNEKTFYHETSWNGGMLYAAVYF